MAQNNNDSISFTHITTTDFMEAIGGGTIQWQFSNSSLCYNKSICKNLFQWNNIVSIIADAALVAPPDELPPSWYVYTNGKWQNALGFPEYGTPIPPTLIASGGIGPGGSGGGGSATTNNTNPNPFGNATVPPPVKPVVDDEMPDSTASPKNDCAGVRGGTAYRDSCKRCVGGTTGKQPCKDTTETTPCDSLQKAAQVLDSIYIKSKTDSILNTIEGLDTLSVEKGFPVFQKFSVNPYNVTDTVFSNTFKTDSIHTGTNTSINYSFSIPYLHVFAADLHTHPPSGYNAPSAKDIYSLIETKTSEKHFKGKFVAAANGNKYAISVTDDAMAALFLNTQSQYLNTSNNDWKDTSAIGKAFENAKADFEKIYDGNPNKENLAYEMAMAAVLKQYKTGISLNKKDALGNFQPIVVNTITHPEKPKNKFYTRDCL